ncbi:hypothetical protein [Streptomyces sp. CBMA152]|uniref:hypothetical protein n=1 Tax=Streptomyces sp. CBMA152 TaxID=1896312 RepID=UPI001CB6BC97|nr:hypothetical protein [Streptomyces sp. CBMA152]
MALTSRPVSKPDRIADRIFDGLPVRVQRAVAFTAAAERALYGLEPVRGATREVALSGLARANKTLAAYNPGLRVRLDGVR